MKTVRSYIENFPVWRCVKMDFENGFTEEQYLRLLDMMEQDPEFPDAYQIPEEWDKNFKRIISETVKKENKSD